MVKKLIDANVIETISEKLKALLLYKGVASPDKKDLIDALILFGKTSLSIVDCILCVKSANRGMELFTFDDQLRKTAAQHHRYSSQQPH